MLRRMIELISRNRSLKRRLPKKFNSLPIMVSPDSALRFWLKDMLRLDPLLFNMCEELVKPGDIVWDIGANVGLFTYSAAHLAGNSGRVLAVEPDIFLSTLLISSKKMESEKRANVDILPVAISDSIKISKFNIASRGRAANFLHESPGSTQTGGIRETNFVFTVSLDWLLQYFTPPTILKIDVEGVENRVLNGAKTILEKFRPKIFCEVSAENYIEVSHCFEKNRYNMFDAKVEKNKRMKLTKAVCNTLAFPRS